MCMVYMCCVHTQLWNVILAKVVCIVCATRDAHQPSVACGLWLAPWGSNASTNIIPHFLAPDFHRAKSVELCWCLRLAACCLLLAACCLLPDACCLLLDAYCLLLAACCLLLAACCLLPAACCLLLAACCLLPAASGAEKCGIMMPKPQDASHKPQATGCLLLVACCLLLAA